MKLFRVDIQIPLAARKARANRAALAVDSQRVCLAEAIYQTFAVILPVIKCHKANHSLHDLCPERIRLPAPDVHNDGERFLINRSADLLKQFKGGVDAGEALAAMGLTVIQIQP